MKKLIFDLCSLSGVSGSEGEVSRYCAEYLNRFTDNVSIDFNNNVVAVLGSENAEKTYFFDAHIDRIGLIVTDITESGFLRVAKVGGVDLRVCPDSAVTVHGTEDLRGIICCMPPHLTDGKDDKALGIDKIFIDLGMPADKVRELVSPGDTISFYKQPAELLNGRVTAAALDNRASVASLLRTAELLSGAEFNGRAVILLSCQEETYQTGAKTVPFDYEIDECISVDVSFASQPEISPPYSRIELGKGPMLGISPILDRAMLNKCRELCESLGIEYQLEVIGGSTGTNADCVAVSKSGVRTMLVSIPERYMHTQAETVAVSDIESTARLLAEYVLSGGAV